MTLGTIAVASHLTRQRGFEPLLLPFPKVPWNDPEGGVEILEREGPETIAGFIAEPITGAAVIGLMTLRTSVTLVAGKPLSLACSLTAASS